MAVPWKRRRLEHEYTVTPDDEAMINFVLGAFADRDAFKSNVVLDSNVLNCFEWMAEKDELESMRCRESMIQAIERDGKRLWADGTVARWIHDADPGVQRISAEVNGPLFSLLVKAADHDDVDCVDLMRFGAPLMGKLPLSGNGEQVSKPKHKSAEEMRAKAGGANVELLGRLKEDKFAEELLKQTVADEGLGRMTAITSPSDIDLNNICISPRFGVDQGLKADGSQKVRCVDSCTESGVNPCTQATEHLMPDGLDVLFEVMRWFAVVMCVIPHVLKVDVDSAFRRVPVAPQDRWAAYIAFLYKGDIKLAGHLAMPFGASSSVFAWDRIGAAIVCIARVLLKIPLLRWTDDLFTAERPACIVHCRDCVVRLVKALLGPGSVAPHKVMSGLPLEVLGVVVEADEAGAAFWPSENKIVKWSAEIELALCRKSLAACGGGKKIAGKLNWSAQHVFCRLGRALVRPLYKSRWNKIVESSLRWWLEVLSLQIRQPRPWTMPATRPVQMLCDARSSPPRLAAVVYTHDGLSFYTDMAPPSKLLALFQDRKDGQICGLELCAIALGLCTFAEYYEGRRLHVFSDNAGSEHATQRGSAKAWDHNLIVHSIWYKAATQRCHMVVDRVPTKDNIADLPSREQYELLHAMGTTFVAPVLDSMFWEPSAWDTLHLSNVMKSK